MNPQQQTFVSEMLRHGDKLAAYRTAYPGDKSDKTIESAVNRLLKHPEVKQAIDEPTSRIRAEVETQLKERLQAELLGMHELQKTLTQIIRGQFTTQKQVRLKDHLETIQVQPTINNVLTAINTYLRIKKAAAPSGSPQGGGQATLKTCLPPWGELEEASGAAPHPFGNIYPPSYPGPYYDPGDPNTKDKLQNLTFDRLTDGPDNNNSPQQNNQSHHFDWKEKSPEPMQLAQRQRTDNSSNPQEISSPESIRNQNDELLSTTQKTTTIHNKKEIPPASVPNTFGRAEGDVHSQRTQTTTIHNNTESSPPVLSRGGNTPHGNNRALLSPKTQQLLIINELRKQGWLTIEEAFNLVNDTYLQNQHSGTYKMLKLYEKAKDARNYPPEQRAPIIKETGWTYHPKHPYMMRRIRALEW